MSLILQMKKVWPRDAHRLAPGLTVHQDQRQDAHPSERSGARTQALNPLWELAFEGEGSRRVWQWDMGLHGMVITLSTGVRKIRLSCN